MTPILKWSIQLKEDAGLTDVIALFNALNLTSDNDNILDNLKTKPGILIQKIEITPPGEKKDGETKG